MSPITIKFLPAKIEDAVELATVSYLANLPTEGISVLFPPERVTMEEQVAFFAGGMKKNIEMMGTEEGRRLGVHVVKAVVVEGGEGEGGRIVGVGIWLIPSGEEGGGKGQVVEGEGVEGDGEVKGDYQRTRGETVWPAGPNAARLMGDLNAAAKPFKDKYVKTGSEMSGLGVHPDYQRKGIGGKIMDWGFAKIDAENMKTFVDSSVEGKGLYEKGGFREVGKVVFDLSEYGSTGVMRGHFLVRGVRGEDIGPLFS